MAARAARSGAGSQAGGREVRRSDGGARVEMVRGRRPGPSLWVWVPAGRKAPSMAQAAAELRDRLDPARLAGEVGFLLDGPPLGESAVGAAADLAALTRGAQAVVALVEGPGDQAPRLELDVDSEAARRLARAAPVTLIIKAPPGRPALEAPLLVYIDGTDRSRPTLDAAVRARAAAVLDGICASLGLLHPAPASAAPFAHRRPARRFRLVLRGRATVERGDQAGTAEVLAGPGEVVREGDVLALIGPPGVARQPLVAPLSGVVLSVDRSAGGPSFVLARVGRTLERAARELGAPTTRGKIAIGWCEWASLRQLGVERIKAKVDTGARTSALHVVTLRELERSPGGDPALPLLEVRIPSGRGGTVLARCQVVDHASVRDSGGHVERRPVIETELVLGGVRRAVRVTLTDRGDMLFPMLIGRSALAGDFVVDPAARFLLGAGR